MNGENLMQCVAMLLYYLKIAEDICHEIKSPKLNN